MNHLITSIASIAIITLSASCTGTSDNISGDKTGTAPLFPDKIAEVSVMELTPTVFSHEIVNNGHLTAREKIDVTFPTTGLISAICVKNGQRVTKGQRLASLDVYRLENQLKKETNAVEAARLEMQDVIISQGYDPQNTAVIPGEVMKLARLRSGLEQAELSLAATLREIADATLVAPINGVVANLSATAGSAATSAPLCRIIDDSRMDVEFQVLESELPMVKPGDKVEVAPFSRTEVHAGTVTEINPMVDENGMIKVWAAVVGGNRLLDGMNVRVSVKRSVGDALVVPKSAVVLRSGRPVIFSLDDDKAMWNYVTIGLENLNQYTIIDGLRPGMKIITAGNVNLAHESPVKVIP